MEDPVGDMCMESMNVFDIEGMFERTNAANRVFILDDILSLGKP